MPLSDEEAQAAAAITAAPDAVVAKVEEDITEPVGALQGLKRVTREDWSSPTVEVGKTYRRTYGYIEPPSSPAWGALSGVTEELLQ